MGLCFFGRLRLRQKEGVTRIPETIKTSPAQSTHAWLSPEGRGKRSTGFHRTFLAPMGRQAIAAERPPSQRRDPAVRRAEANEVDAKRGLDAVRTTARKNAEAFGPPSPATATARSSTISHAVRARTTAASRTRRFAAARTSPSGRRSARTSRRGGACFATLLQRRPRPHLDAFEPLAG